MLLLNVNINMTAQSMTAAFDNSGKVLLNIESDF